MTSLPAPSIGAQRARLLGTVAHCLSMAEGSQTTLNAAVHLGDARAALSSLRELRAAHGDWATDSCGRAEREIDRTTAEIEAKWKRWHEREGR
jgi:hypothetical protein